MFLTLLAVTLLLSAAVAWAVSRAFSQPIERILSRIIADSISAPRSPAQAPSQTLPVSAATVSAARWSPRAVILGAVWCRNGLIPHGEADRADGQMHLAAVRGGRRGY